MALHRRQFLAIPGVLLFRSTARADLYDDYINSMSRQPFVAFLGREATPSTIGHAFVALGMSLDAGLIVYERFYGLYPKDGVLAAVKSVFSPTSGKLDVTWADVSWDTEFRRDIDDDKKAIALTQFQKWGSDAPQYSLLGNSGLNCNGLVGDVATSLGLKVPNGAGTTRPWKFINALKAAN